MLDRRILIIGWLFEGLKSIFKGDSLEVKTDGYKFMGSYIFLERCRSTSRVQTDLCFAEIETYS